MTNIIRIGLWTASVEHHHVIIDNMERPKDGYRIILCRDGVHQATIEHDCSREWKHVAEEAIDARSIPF